MTGWRSFNDSRGQKRFDYYQILGVKRTDSLETIQKKYRLLALKHHPDRNMGNPEGRNKCLEMMKFINEAYSTLKDDSTRKEYDAEYDAAFRGEKVKHVDPAICGRAAGYYREGNKYAERFVKDLQSGYSKSADVEYRGAEHCFKKIIEAAPDSELAELAEMNLEMLKEYKRLDLSSLRQERFAQYGGMAFFVLGGALFSHYAAQDFSA